MVPVRNQIPSPATMKQGIVTILGSGGRDGSGAHIRRTLSADMSSKNWLQQNGVFSPIKNSASASSEYFHQTPCDRDDVWRSIQSSDSRGAAKMESWDSILSRKRDPPPPAYVHPLVKRPSSALSDKSLEICTESIGSESGSDCFQSPTNCSTEGLSEVYEVLSKENRAKRVVRYKSSPVRPLPPPLPSISAGGVDGGGSQLHMQSRRENGRLIVEAVSVSPENYFEARRGDGRLVLTLIRGGGKMAVEEEEEDTRVEEVFDDMEDVPAEEEVVDYGVGEEGEEEILVEKKLYLPSASKKGLVMKTFVEEEDEEDEEEEEEISIIQSLPPFPIMARLIPTTPSATTTATSFNMYKYFWRNKTTVSCGFVNPVITSSREGVQNKDSDNNNTSNKATYENRKLVIVKGNKGDDLVPYSTRGCMEPRRSLKLVIVKGNKGDDVVPYSTRGCMEPRRSLILLEPYCISTS